MSDRHREQSISGGAEDSDFESQAGDPTVPGKPGRKKNPNSQAARRDQNRIAQREFRLRKQQRIRDLEARVEILSGTKDEALGEMRNILKDLMTENHTLRGLLRNLAVFIGDGAGGILPKMGWELQDFNNFINKGETDTAWEGYQRRKTTPHSKKDETEMPSSYADKFTAQGAQKRPSDVEVNGNATKRQRSGDKSYDNTSNGFPMMMPMPTSSIPGPQTSPMFPAAGPPRAQDDDGLFSDLLRGANGPSFFMPQSSGTSTQYASPNSSMDGYSRSFMPQVNIGMEQSSSTFYEPPSASTSVAQPRLQQSSENRDDDDLDDDNDPKRNEAFKLINYHLDNYRRNRSYCLPASLRPTIVQRTMSHESVIDRVLHPELRDRMILLREKYDLVDLLVDMRSAVTIHGDDVLAHQNWELSETFVHKYNYLVDALLLKIVNRWRRERGDQEIILPEEGLPES